MIDCGNSSALLSLGSVFVGGILGYGLESFRRRDERAREKESIRAALVAEATTVGELIERAEYVQIVRQVVASCENATDGSKFGGVMIHLTENYLSVFEANSGKLGLLPKEQVTAFTRFHLLAKTLIDSFKPGSPWSSGEHEPEDLKRALEYGLAAFEELENTLNEIKQF